MFIKSKGKKNTRAEGIKLLLSAASRASVYVCIHEDRLGSRPTHAREIRLLCDGMRAEFASVREGAGIVRRDDDDKLEYYDFVENRNKNARSHYSPFRACSHTHTHTHTLPPLSTWRAATRSLFLGDRSTHVNIIIHAERVRSTGPEIIRGRRR